jgi:hypothetical protein
VEFQDKMKWITQHSMHLSKAKCYFSQWWKISSCSVVYTGLLTASYLIRLDHSGLKWSSGPAVIFQNTGLQTTIASIATHNLLSKYPQYSHPGREVGWVIRPAWNICDLTPLNFYVRQTLKMKCMQDWSEKVKNWSIGLNMLAVK